MSPELAIRLAQHETDGLPLNVKMRKANEIFKANSSDWQQPFAPVDVVYATFVDYMRESASQRERDLVFISERLSAAWTTMHITVQAMGEQPSPADEDELHMLAPALNRLGLLHLLTDGLRDDLCRWVNETALQKKKRN